MKTILLVRHGETDALGKYLAGSIPNCHLNQKGQSQAQNLATQLSRFPIQAIYTSPLERTTETATYLAKPHGLIPIVMNELTEVNFGDWEGRTFAELHAIPEWQCFNVARSIVRPPQGELMIEVQTRMLQALERLLANANEELIAIVSHADPLRALLAYYLGIALDQMQRFQIDTASVSIVRFFDYLPTVLGVNFTGELAL